MKEFKITRKILALLLSLSLITGMMPATAWNAFAAEGDTTYVLAASDFQPTDSSNTTGVNLLNKILDKVDDNYTSMDGFIFAGDYDYNYNASQAGKEALQGAVQKVYGTEMNEVYIQGNHDADSLVGSVLTSSGENDADDYGVFVINEKDYMWYNDDAATIQNTAASLETYLNAKRNAGYTKPIFVVSHLPLHYCMRTQVGGGDGKHANYIFDVLNEAGEAGLNIIFMFGHNHSHGWDDPYGGAAIFLKKGDSINIAQNSTTNYNVETLNFTYMNAGYVSYYRNVNSGAETDLSMTTFAITDTDVTIERYTADGLHDLKSAGVANTHASTGSSVDGSCSTNHGGNETYSPDTTTVASSYTMTLNTEITPAGEEVDGPGTGGTGTEASIERVTSLEQGVPYIIVCNRSGDVLTGTANGDDLQLNGSASVDTEDLWYYNGTNLIYGDPESTNSYLRITGGTASIGDANGNNTVSNVFLNDDGTTFSIGAANGQYLNQYGGEAATIAAGYNRNGNDDSGSRWIIYKLNAADDGTVDTTGGDWVTITEPTEEGTRYVYELDTNGVDERVEYLIVANGYEKALKAAASSNNATDINIDGNYAYADSDTYGWTFTRYNNGVYYIRLNNNNYLTLSNNALGSSNSTGNSRRWTVVNNSDGSYDIVRNDYNLRWSNSNGVFQASSSNEGPVRLYKYVRTEAIEAQAGIYGKIEGELTYTVSIGTSAEDAMAAVQAGITGYSSNNSNGSNATALKDSDLKWTLDSDYDGTTPGEYAVTITYNGVKLGVAKVVVPSVAISRYSISPKSATVRQGTAQSISTGSNIVVVLENGDYYTVPVTISMLSKNGAAISTAEAGTQTDLTVTYNGVVITNEYTLTVKEKALNNYPEYPDEGAVKVNKTATGVQLQSTGVAQVELSASGVPSQKGADVVVVIDTSSSMKDNNVGNTGKTRIEVLSESLEQMLQQFQTPGISGMTPDIDIAIIDFNGYYDSALGDFDKISLSNSQRDNEDLAKVFTGENAGEYIKDNGLSNEDFVGAETLNAESVADNFTNSTCASGTNYDGALENAYNLLAAKQAANGDEERDSYVIFLSDGAPFRYNGYNNGSTKSTYNGWDTYLNGNYASETELKEAFPNSNYLNFSHFYNGNGTNHPHRWAEAIKGTKGDPYSVISRNAANKTPAYQDTVSGLGATIYSIGFGLADDGSDSDGGKVSVATQQELIEVISSGTGYNYPNVQSADELTTAFTQIVTSINYAASNARFVDQMGDAFDLKITPITDLDGNAITDESGTITPKIEIIQYDIYQKTEVDKTVDGVKVTEDMVGKRKGTFTTLETVTFKEVENGTEAYSDQLGEKNILTDGVINAKYFWYNNNAASTMIDTDGDSTAEYKLEPETFYWKMGTVTTYELAMRYYVYLEGSKEGTCPAGSYETNESAVLYYDNYLGNDSQKETVSPVLGWESANVSYAFYLVNEKGEVVVNQTTGETGTFANKIAVTSPVMYKEVMLNSTGTVEPMTVAASGVLPNGYEVYDESAVYTVNADSDGTGSWEIASGKNVATTYVTQYKKDNATAYSNALMNDSPGDDYTHTVVWFAVVWKTRTINDTVVIDYGLPVDINVLGNDMFGEYGKLNAVGTEIPISASKALYLVESEFADAPLLEDSYRKVEVKDDKVRYTPKTMSMDQEDTFAYEVHYTGTNNPGYYYGEVTVIPATTIYYEDSFVDFKVYDKGTNGWAENETEEWTIEGTTIDATQAEDRPGTYHLSNVDANNVYGYDRAYDNMSTYSMGSARKLTATATRYGTAEFEFYGTGFDIVALTSNKTGTITVKVEKIEVVEDEEGNKETTLTPVKDMVVDTYYGYTKDTDGNWVITNSADDNALYQVPVIESELDEYGHYKVTVKAAYNKYLNHTTNLAGYDLYLDAIRIYDPTGVVKGEVTNTTVSDAYIADGEGWPVYTEVRNSILEAGTFDATDSETVNGVVFIDGVATNANLADYGTYGPNNEVYLASGQAIAFTLDGITDNVADVQIGLKSVGGNATVKIYNAADTSLADAKEKALSTATGMYYSITNLKNGIVVISNTGASGTVSVTDVKVTYKTNPNAVSTTDSGVVFRMSRNAVQTTLASFTEVSVEEPDTPVIPEEPDTPPVVPDTPITPEEPEVDKPGVEEPEEPVVAPAKVISVKTNKKVYTQGDKVKVTVTTNGAATKVTVGAKTLKNLKVKYGNKTWTFNVNASKIGKLNINAVAYNKNGAATKKVTKTVTVKKYAPKIFKVNLNKKTVKVGAKYTATVKAGSTVKHIRVNGKKITKFTTKNGVKTFKVTLKATKVGKQKVKVVAYNKALYPTNPKFKTITVKKK